MKRICPSISLVLAGPVAAAVAELLMREQQACGWCERWNEEIGRVYPKAAESRSAPLRRVDIHDAWPINLEALRRAVFTPTAVLFEDGGELAGSTVIPARTSSGAP